jgi:hypothetical protein
VDAKQQLIVEQQVTNQVVDMVCDNEACEKAGIDPYVRRPHAVPRSEKSCFARMSSATTRPATTRSVRQARFCIPVHHRRALDRMDARMTQHPDFLRRRHETGEHPFCPIKQWMNQGAFLMCRLRKVRAEFSLTALVYISRRCSISSSF